VHAKVIIIDGGPGRRAVFRSSMNLNKNLRTEQFDIDVDDAVAEFYRAWFDGLWEESGRTHDNRRIIATIYDRYRALPAGDGALVVAVEGAQDRPGLRQRRVRKGDVTMTLAQLDSLIGD
jgi:hypothetical protein